MRAKIAANIEKLRGSYWFIPTMMVLTSILFSNITIRIDKTTELEFLKYLAWLSVKDLEAARSFLSVVTGSMISTIGVTFSITIAALVQASSQLGPRLLSNFLRDRGNQSVLGILTATYTFCLFTLKSISPSQESIPNLSITIATILTISSLGALVYFFHHISTSLQANHVINQVGTELQESIKKIYPEKMDYIQDFKLISPEDIPSNLIEGEAYQIKSMKGGYLQAIDINSLMEIAQSHQLVMQTELRAGEFTAVDNILINIWPKSQEIQSLEERINNAFILGEERLRLQDIRFYIDQLVEITLRALSPGINDPFTAIACIDQLTLGAIEIFKRSIAEGYHYDREGKLRLLTKSLTFTELIETVYNQIRRNSLTNVAINIKLLKSIIMIAPHTRTREQIITLKEQADMLLRGSKESIKEIYDLKELEENHAEAIIALNEKANENYFKI